MSLEEKNLQAGEPPVDTSQIPSENETSETPENSDSSPGTESVVDTSTPQTEESQLTQDNESEAPEESEEPDVSETEETAADASSDETEDAEAAPDETQSDSPESAEDDQADTADEEAPAEAEETEKESPEENPFSQAGDAAEEKADHTSMHFGEDPNEDLNAAFSGLNEDEEDLREEDLEDQIDETPEDADVPDETEDHSESEDETADLSEPKDSDVFDEDLTDEEPVPDEAPAAAAAQASEPEAQKAESDISARTRRRQQRPSADETESAGKKKAAKGKTDSGSKKTNWKIPAIIVGVLAAIYLIGVFHFSNSFLPSTYIDGFAAVNKSPDTITEEIQNQTNSRSVELVGMNDETMTVTAEEISLSFAQDVDYDQILSEQNPWSWPIRLLGGGREDYNGSVTYSHHKLDAVVADSPFVKNSNIVETVDAKAVYQDGEYVIQDEVYGDRVNEDALKSAIVTALSDNVTEVNLEEDKVYVQPNVTKDNETLKASVEALNKDLETVITYKFGDDTETLDKDTFATWLSTDSNANVSVDKDKVAEYVEELADKYDTLYTSVPFTTSSGSTVSVYALGFGWEIDQETETEELYQLLESGTSQSDREPVYLSEGEDRSSDNAIGDDYIEISISDQTMWCYKDGQLVVSTPITTGTAGSYDTPTGLYEIQGMDTNVTLVGEGYASAVTYWIPFNGGIGIHDASWRSSYGGTVYLSSGSHGCVNTPYAAVETIFNNAYVGEPVVVY